MYPFPEKTQTICARRYLHRPAYCAAARVCCHQHPIPRRAPLFSTNRPSICGKLFFSSCRYAVRIPVFARKTALFMQSSSEFPAISCLVHPQFIFILHDRTCWGPHITAPKLEELLCTKPNSRATPKRRPALYMP